MAYIGKQPVIGNFVKLDAISVVNGQASYTMQNVVLILQLTQMLINF